MTAVGSHAGRAVLGRGLRAERNQALQPVLRRLPDDFLAALIDGIGRADVIAPGQLFAGRSGGCAVGVLLRSLEPGHGGRRWIWGRYLRRSVFTLRRGLVHRAGHLYALEQVFDRTIRLAQATQPTATPEAIAAAAAQWIADEARAELVLRELDRGWQASAPGTPELPPSGIEGSVHRAEHAGVA